jgi:hypothetical protein
MKSLQILLLSMTFALPAFCQDGINKEQEYIPDWELELSLGYGRANEANMFNSNNPYAAGGGFAFNLGLRMYLNYNFSLGVHFKGYTDTIKNYDTYSTMGYPNDSTLILGNFNLGLNIRYTWGNQWQPFVFAGPGFVSGSISSWEESEPFNEFKGVAIEFGAGLGYMAFQSTMISITVSQSLGVAWWVYEPSYGASSNKLDPGYFTIQLGVSYFFN